MKLVVFDSEKKSAATTVELDDDGHMTEESMDAMSRMLRPMLDMLRSDVEDSATAWWEQQLRDWRP